MLDLNKREKGKKKIRTRRWCRQVTDRVLKKKVMVVDGGTCSDGRRITLILC